MGGEGEDSFRFRGLEPFVVARPFKLLRSPDLLSRSVWMSEVYRLLSASGSSLVGLYFSSSRTNWLELRDWEISASESASAP